MQNALTQAQASASVRAQEYCAGEDRPLRGYAAMMAIYAGGVAGAAGLTAARGHRLPERLSPYEVALIAAATQKISRTITKAAVTSPLRACLTLYAGPGGPAELHEEARRDSPLRHAAGEWITCPFCMDAWVATILGLGMVGAPRLTRIVAGLFTALAGADFLQLAYTSAQQAATKN